MNNEFWLEDALKWAKMGTCKNRSYGCVLVYGNEYISRGFTQVLPGNQCYKNECVRLKNNIPHGRGYEECGSIHAEQMALIDSMNIPQGTVCYLACVDTKGNEIVDNIEPCYICKKLLQYAGIKTVITRNNIIRY